MWFTLYMDANEIKGHFDGTFTQPVEDVNEWLDRHFPEGDASVQHSLECDQECSGDECVGGCPIWITEGGE